MVEIVQDKGDGEYDLGEGGDIKTFSRQTYYCEQQLENGRQ